MPEEGVTERASAEDRTAFPIIERGFLVFQEKCRGELAT
jgi:hypothetical protein